MDTCKKLAAEYMSIIFDRTAGYKCSNEAFISQKTSDIEIVLDGLIQKLLDWKIKDIRENVIIA